MIAVTPSNATADTAARLDAALARYRAGDAAAAAALFAEILESAPDHPDALRLRGLALVRAGDAAAALPLLARARRLRPGDPLTHLHHGIGLLEAGRPARAAALFRRAAMLRRDDPAPWINFAAALLALDRPQAARAAARRAIRLAPGSAAALHLLGRGHAAIGDLDAARATLAEAVRREPGRVDAWVDFGLVLCRLGRMGEATRALEAALVARPGHGAAEATLAAFALVRGEQDEALARLRAVLAREPGCVPARLNLANALLLDREPVEALALLAGAPPGGREGAHWRAHRALALMLLGRDAEAKADLDAILPPLGDAELLIASRRLHLARRAGEAEATEAMAARVAALAEADGAALFEHRIIALFDLARFRHQQGRLSEAFAHWRHGHRLLARLQPFSRDEHRAFVDASIAAYGRERLRDGPRAANDDRAPVFIVGMPRSGTSLCEQILAAHTLVHGGGERATLHHIVTRLAGATLDAASVDRIAALDAETLTEAARGYLAELRAEAPDARLVTDKMPGNALHLGFIATLLPGARVIHCRRDPRDTGLSIFQLRFFGHHPYAHHLGDLGWYIGEHERLMAHWRAVLTLPILEVELADWVADFPATLRRVLGFLELPYDAACERYYEVARRVRTASAEQVRRPINAQGIGRWRAYEAELAPMIAELRAAGLVGND